MPCNCCARSLQRSWSPPSSLVRVSAYVCNFQVQISARMTPKHGSKEDRRPTSHGSKGVRQVMPAHSSSRVRTPNREARTMAVARDDPCYTICQPIMTNLHPETFIWLDLDTENSMSPPAVGTSPWHPLGFGGRCHPPGQPNNGPGDAPECGWPRNSIDIRMPCLIST